MFRTLRINPPQNAGHRPYTWKPGTNNAASFNISALITSQNIPKVRMVRGKVTTFNSAPTVLLTSPMTTAAISAVPNPRTTNPGTNRATSRMHNALNTQCTRSFTIFFSATESLDPQRLFLGLNLFDGLGPSASRKPTA